MRQDLIHHCIIQPCRIAQCRLNLCLLPLHHCVGWDDAFVCHRRNFFHSSIGKFERQFGARLHVVLCVDAYVFRRQFDSVKRIVGHCVLCGKNCRTRTSKRQRKHQEYHRYRGHTHSLLSLKNVQPTFLTKKGAWGYGLPKRFGFGQKLGASARGNARVARRCWWKMIDDHLDAWLAHWLRRIHRQILLSSSDVVMHRLHDVATI